MRGFFLALVALFVAVSCSNSSKTVLEGTWIEACQPDGADSFQSVYQFRGNTFETFTREFIGNTTCSGNGNGGELTKGTFSIGGKDSRNNSVQGAQTVDWTAEGVTTYDIFVLSADGKKVQFGATSGSRSEDRPVAVDGIWFTLN